MQDLKRLINIISNNTPSVFPIIDHSDDSSLEGRLYHTIRGNEVLTDEEACLLLYGEAKLTPSYRMLKSRLRKKLLNSLFFLELSESHFRESAILHADCFSLVQQANKLITLSEMPLAAKLADQIIVIAQKAELNDMLAKAYEIKLHAFLASNNKTNFESNLKLLQHYISLEGKEREAFYAYFKLKFEVSFNISIFRKQAVAYEESLPVLKKLWETSGSSKIYDYYHLMMVSQRELLGDYEGVLAAIEEAEKLLADGIINKLWFNERFNNFIKVYALLRLGKLDEGLDYSKLYLNSFREGSNNWFAFLENYMILALHKRDYNLAVELCLSALNKGVLDISLPKMREMWEVIIRYTSLFSDTIRTAKAITQRGQENFILSKDKEGYNLPLIILEYLENIPKLDEDSLEQYAARFSKYSTKYLKGEIWERAKVFVKLLILSMKEEGEKLEKKAAPLLQKLKNTPPPRDPVAEVEIIPYEHLWELVLELRQKRVQK